MKTYTNALIVVRKKHKPFLKKDYDIKSKKIIVLDITDSKNRVIETHPEFEKYHGYDFNRRWTYPQLRKAIKPYLPLKIK